MLGSFLTIGNPESLLATDRSIGKKAVFTVHWETIECPIGYPCTLKPLVFAHQDVLISGSIKNVGDASFTCKISVIVKNATDDSIVFYAMKDNETILDALEVKNFSEIVTNQEWLMWNTGIHVGEFYVQGRLEIIDTGEIQYASTKDGYCFEVGKEWNIDFVNFRTENISYEDNKIVQMNASAYIENTGNQPVSGTVIMKLWQFDNITKIWDTNFWDAGSFSILLSPGDKYFVSSEWPGWDTDAHDNTTYKIYMAVMKSGSILPHTIGDKTIGLMEIGLPEIQVDRVVEPIETEPDNQDVKVSLRIQPKGKSLRDAGVFGKGEFSISDLDAVFLCDTSGSMNNEWNDLCNIISDIVTALEVETTFSYKIFGLAYKRACSDAAWSQGWYNSNNYACGSECYGPGTAGVARFYPWKSDAVRVIFPIADEGPYRGVPNNAADTQSIEDAIVECKAQSVIAYPMWGDLGGSEEQLNIAHMKHLAQQTGGNATHWTDTTTALEVITGALYEEIKIAGKNITITDEIIDIPGFVEPDLNSFTFDGKPIASTDLIVTNHPDSIEILFDKTYLDLSSLTANPPETHTISYLVHLPALLPGETRNITKEGSYTYDDAYSGITNPLETIPHGFVNVNNEADILVIVDPDRMKEVYDPDSDVDRLMENLTEYCIDNKGSLYNLSVYRKYWESEYNGDKSAFENIYNLPSYECSKQGRWEWNDWPQYLEGLITTLSIDRKINHTLLVGSDIIIPFQRVTSPRSEIDYDYISDRKHNILWTDFPYSDLNSDDWPDISISRLVGDMETIKNVILNAKNQYQSTETLLACLSWNQNYAHDISDDFINEWGFSNAYEYFETATTSIRDLRIDGLSFLNRLDDGQTIIYTYNHGNDYRSLDGSNNIQNFSCNKGHIFLDATDVNLGDTHPIMVTPACHGGSTYPDDTSNMNIPISFFEHGAINYQGSTGYTPAAIAAIFYSEHFFPILKEKTPIGTALFKAKRSLYESQNTIYSRMFLYESQLYGLPNYIVHVPNDPTPPPGYNVTFDISNNQTMLKINITEYEIINVETDNGTRNIVKIPGARLYAVHNEYIIPEIVEVFSLPNSVNLDLISDISIAEQTLISANLPLANQGAISKISYPYFGGTMDIPELYPRSMLDYEIINEVNGTKTVVFKIFPMTYNEDVQEAHLYKNLSFYYQTINTPPSSPLELIVNKDASKRVVETENSTKIFIKIINNGLLDAHNLSITDEIPTDYIPTSISHNGSYNNSNRTITWYINKLSCQEIQNFIIISYELTTPNIEGNNTLSTTVEYSSESGLEYPPISKSIVIQTIAGDTSPGGDEEYQSKVPLLSPFNILLLALVLIFIGLIGIKNKKKP